ncbi:hypothetical protein CTI12_AA538940 [Artemisia annua]|uniref:Uncharacterized protein n=1 Tax=Artemisia annua TaxID=35608 RepID=A0A2U1L2A5_ARTAN|nr:hypothetical protein CTI12_AA538940 [Artemisia annua]
MSVKMRTTCTWTERPYEASLFPGIGFGLFLRSLGGTEVPIKMGNALPLSAVYVLSFPSPPESERKARISLHFQIASFPFSAFCSMLAICAISHGLSELFVNGHSLSREPLSSGGNSHHSESTTARAS